MPLGLWQGNCSGKVIVCTIYCLGGLTSSLQVGPPGHVLPCRRQGGGKGCLPAHRGEDCWRRPQNGPCLQPAQVSACSSASSACWQAQARLPQLSLPHWLACTRTEDRRSPTPAACAPPTLACLLQSQLVVHPLGLPLQQSQWSCASLSDHAVAGHATLISALPP